MSFQVGKRYNISKVLQIDANTNNEWEGSPEIITCTGVDDDGKLWSTELVHLGTRGDSKDAEAVEANEHHGYMPAGWCISEDVSPEFIYEEK